MSWKRFFRRSRWDQERARELEAYIEIEIADNVTRGMAPGDARSAALRKLGNPTRIHEEIYSMNSIGFFETLKQDLVYALRIFRKDPGFTVVALVTLTLGIGASTAVFGIVNAVLLKPLPFPDAGKILFVSRLTPPGVNIGFEEYPWSRGDAQFVQQESKAFESMAAFKSDSFNLTGRGEPIRVDGLRAGAGFFPSLGVAPSIGRPFTQQEDQPGHQYEVVLSHRLWQERFNGDETIIGSSVELNGAAYTIIGVMPPGFVFPRAEELPGVFSFPHEIELWVPLALSQGPPVRGEEADLALIGRVRENVTISQAQAEYQVILKRRAEQFPRYKAWYTGRAVPLARVMAGDTRQPLLLLLGAVMVVLGIVCSNVANLLLTRSVARKREFTVRAALGASRRRLVTQLLTESLVLASLGGVLGTLAASAGIQLVKVLGPTNIPRLHEAGLDVRVLAFAVGASLLTGVLFGLAPAFAAVRADLVESLKEGGHRLAAGAGSPVFRKALLVAEVALALVLVLASGLLVRTFSNTLRADPGFSAEHVLTFELTLPALKYPDQQHIVALYQKALGELRAAPGVESAAIVETLPMNGTPESTMLLVPGKPSTDAKDAAYSNYTIVSPGYFATVGTPLLRGRDFLDSDAIGSMPVTIVNETMAKKFWPGEDPLGKQVGPPIPGVATIIGIVADSKHLSLREEPLAEMYVPYTQKVWPSLLTMSVVARAKGDPASIAGSARQAIHRADADLPLAKVVDLRTIVTDSLITQRFSMLLLGSFGALALLLTAVGMYGVIAYSVKQRTPEIGVRMALGAPRSTVFRMILGQGARLAGLGMLIGLAAALGVTRMMASFLYGVRATDPLTFAAVSLLLVAVALLACYLPARRAMDVDPVVALRHE